MLSTYVNEWHQKRKGESKQQLASCSMLVSGTSQTHKAERHVNLLQFTFGLGRRQQNWHCIPLLRRHSQCSHYSKSLAERGEVAIAFCYKSKSLNHGCIDGRQSGKSPLLCESKHRERETRIIPTRTMTWRKKLSPMIIGYNVRGKSTFSQFKVDADLTKDNENINRCNPETRR